MARAPTAPQGSPRRSTATCSPTTSAPPPAATKMVSCRRHIQGRCCPSYKTAGLIGPTCKATALPTTRSTILQATFAKSHVAPQPPIPSWVVVSPPTRVVRRARSRSTRRTATPSNSTTSGSVAASARIRGNRRAAPGRHIQWRPLPVKPRHSPSPAPQAT